MQNIWLYIFISPFLFYSPLCTFIFIWLDLIYICFNVVIYYIVKFLNPSVDKNFYICLYMLGKFSGCFVGGGFGSFRLLPSHTTLFRIVLLL